MLCIDLDLKISFLLLIYSFPCRESKWRNTLQRESLTYGLDKKTSPLICFVSFLSQQVTKPATTQQVASVKTGLKPTGQIAIETQLFVPITVEMLLFGNKEHSLRMERSAWV